jgi:hypothetical protein
LIMTESTVPATDSIDVDQALALLERAVATQGGDFIYNPGGHGSCHYTAYVSYDGDPDPRAKTGCLVGVALRFAGINLDDASGSITSLWEPGDMHWPGLQQVLTHDAVQVMQAAQGSQDKGHTWGAALGAAHAVAADLAM